MERFLHKIKVESYEDQRSKPYKETACRVGVCHALRPTPLYEETLLVCIEKIRGSFLTIHSRRVADICSDGQPLGEPVSGLRYGWTAQQAWAGSQADYGFNGYRKSHRSHPERQAERDESQREMAVSHRQGSEPKHLQKFFISLGARFGRIMKRPKGVPSLQLYAYKCEKLQERVNHYNEGLIDLYLGDESHTCTEGYVPFSWMFPWEEVCVPSQKEFRLNIFGMISYANAYHGFTTTGSITTEKLVDYLDRFSMTIKKETFIVLDNAKVHRSKLMMWMRKIWEKRGLFLFFLFFQPPYSPHLNISETLWRIFKGKWIQPADYASADSLFYAVNRSLAAVGTSSFIKFSKYA